MNRNLLKKISLFRHKLSLFLLPLFIILMHLPFVFARVKPNSKNTSIPINQATSYAKSVSMKTANLSYLLYDSLQLNTLGLSEAAFDYAIKGYDYLRSLGKLNNDGILSIVDFSLPSGKKRLFVIDMQNCKVMFNTYVAHGRNSGKEYAREFSNNPESFKSSLGFYITKGTYIGEHGFSLKLEGEEKGINDNAFSRAIVIHCADYVNEGIARSQGYIGRSLGCPALPKKYATPIIKTIKDGSCFFMYSPNSRYLSHSPILQSAS